MTVHAEDLPLAVRKRLGIDAPKASRKSRAGISEHAPCPGHCACGEPFPSYIAWERGHYAAGHRRWSIDLPQGAPPT